MAVEVGEIRKEGWVNKESAVIRTYRKRWMVLTPDRLYSFKGEKKYTVRSRLLGTPYPYPYPYSHPTPNQVQSYGCSALPNPPLTLTLTLPVAGVRLLGTPYPTPDPHQDPTEEIDLRQCGTVKSADDLTNRPFSFTVQVPERNYFLAAMSDADRNEWVAAYADTFAPGPPYARTSLLRAARTEGTGQLAPRRGAAQCVRRTRTGPGHVARTAYTVWCHHRSPPSAAPPRRADVCAATRRR